jgi:hypothetical protein
MFRTLFRAHVAFGSIPSLILGPLMIMALSLSQVGYAQSQDTGSDRERVVAEGEADLQRPELRQRPEWRIDEVRPLPEVIEGLRHPPRMPVESRWVNPRERQPEPLRAIQHAVAAFQERDPNASFGYFNGYVDRFSTSPRSTVPDYARGVLDRAGLSTEPREPRLLPDPVHARQRPKPAFDRDANPKVQLPLVPEEDTPQRTRGRDDGADEGRVPDIRFERSEPAPDRQEMVEWQRPDERQYQAQRRVVEPILQSFLSQHSDVFGIDGERAARTLRLVDYQPGAYVSMARFDQLLDGSEPVIYGNTIVEFDVNWNVIGISRAILTPEKLNVPELDEGAITTDTSVHNAVREVARVTRTATRAWEPLRAPVRGVDPVRELRVWDVELINHRDSKHYAAIVDAQTGRVLNTSSLVSEAPSGADLNRWWFGGGNQMNPTQVVSTNIYTRSSNTLEHDFFYMKSDHRCEGEPRQDCDATGHDTEWCAGAHGAAGGASQIRATRRNQLDFVNYFPGGHTQGFAETNAYFWSRYYMQWLKPGLDALGKLPASAANYPRVLMIVNCCRGGSAHHRSYNISTVHGKGEDSPVIRLAHRDSTRNSWHNAACEGGGCFDNPSNIAHELNHFVLWEFFDVSSVLDCNGGVQGRFTHEGALGTVLPHAFWHNFYGIGYEPSSTDHLYFSHSDIGRVHTGSGNNLTLANHLCVDYEDDPYRAGRVVGQPLWEIYHGNRIDGSDAIPTWYPSTDRDFNVIVHWAAELQMASTYKDRYELANRVMEIMDKHSNLPSQGKQDWCAIFEHHGLRTFIDEDYCS